MTYLREQSATQKPLSSLSKTAGREIMLSTDWQQRKSAYDFVVIGSVYGGAIAAARIATANLSPKPSLQTARSSC